MQFGPQPAVGELIQQQLQQQLGLVLGFQRHLGASIVNTRIFSRNRRNVHVLTPLQKYTEGNGHDLALTICDYVALPVAAQAYQLNAAIGDVPNQWIPRLHAYTHLYILRLVIFYNDDLGIEAGDNLDVRKEKVHSWLIDELWH